MKLTHLNQHGEANMVDVGDKAITSRTAIAESFVVMSEAAMALVIDGNNKKGDVFATARIAGIQAAKRTAELIPLCHTLLLSSVKVTLEALPERHMVRIECRVRTSGQTGVEMEALTGASIAALTVYDMCKAVDKGIRVEQTALLVKTGGASGEWHRQEAPEL